MNAKEKFWCEVYLASVNYGNNNEDSAEISDQAVEDYEERYE